MIKLSKYNENLNNRMNRSVNSQKSTEEDFARKIDGRIDIVYGNEEQITGVEIYYSNSANGSFVKVDKDLRQSLLSINENEFSSPILELNKFKIDKQSFLSHPTALYKANLATGTHRLKYEFSSGKTLKNWTITGVAYKVADKNIIEVPSKFSIQIKNSSATTNKTYEIKMDNQTATLFETSISKKLMPIKEPYINLTIGDGTKIYNELIITISEWTALKQSGNNWLYSSTTVTSNQEFDYGKWNAIKLSKCYDNQTEEYGGKDFTEFKVIKELTNSNGDINYGISSGTFKATILNRDRKLDLGSLKNQVTMGKRIIPYLSEDGTFNKIGTFFVNKWQISLDNSWVDIEGNDRLYDLHSKQYRGYFPVIGENPPIITAYDILIDIIESINSTYKIALSNKFYHPDQIGLLINDLKTSLYLGDSNEIITLLNKRKNASKKVIEGIDLNYENIIIPNPYLERQSLWNALENLTKSFLGMAFINSDDKLIVSTDLYDANLYILNDTAYIDFVRPCNHGVLPSQVSIRPYNAYSMSKPVFKQAIATEGTISYTSYDFGEKGNLQNAKPLITYYLNEEHYEAITENNVKYREYELYLPKYVKEGSFKIDKNVEILNYEEHKNYIQFKVLDSLIKPTSYLTMFGGEIQKNSTEISSRTYENFDNWERLDYNAGTLLNNQLQANQVINRLLQLYYNGKGTFESNWIGNNNLEVSDGINFEYIYPFLGSIKGIQKINYLETQFDGGLEQNIKAIECSIKAKDCNNCLINKVIKCPYNK